MTPPGSVYLAALVSRFTRICSIRMGSTTRLTGVEGRRTVIWCRFASIKARVLSSDFSTMEARLTGSGRSVSLPVLTRVTSSRSSMIRIIDWTPCSMIDRV